MQDVRIEHAKRRLEMEKPTITIQEATYEMKAPTMKTWREVAKIAESAEGESLTELMEKRVKGIAVMYGIGEDAVENMAVEDVIPAYKAAESYVIGKMFEKLEKIPKNAETEQGKE